MCLVFAPDLLCLHTAILTPGQLAVLGQQICACSSRAPQYCGQRIEEETHKLVFNCQTLNVVSAILCAKGLTRKKDIST